MSPCGAARSRGLRRLGPALSRVLVSSRAPPARPRSPSFAGPVLCADRGANTKARPRGSPRGGGADTDPTRRGRGKGVAGRDGRRPAPSCRPQGRARGPRLLCPLSAGSGRPEAGGRSPRRGPREAPCRGAALLVCSFIRVQTLVQLFPGGRTALARGVDFFPLRLLMRVAGPSPGMPTGSCLSAGRRSGVGDRAAGRAGNREGRRLRGRGGR